MEIEEKYKRDYRLDKQRGSISLFTCPVEVCGFQTDQSPEALRMHMVIKADPNCIGRHCKEHEAFVATHPETQLQDGVQCLTKFPSSLHEDVEITNLKD